KELFDIGYKQFLRLMDYFRSNPDFKTWESTKMFPEQQARLTDLLSKLAKSKYFDHSITHIPELTDSTSLRQLPFEDIQVAIISADVTGSNHFTMKLIFTSKPWVLLKTLDPYLLITEAENISTSAAGKEVKTTQIQLSDKLFVASMQSIS